METNSSKATPTNPNHSKSTAQTRNTMKTNTSFLCLATVLALSITAISLKGRLTSKAGNDAQPTNAHQIQAVITPDVQQVPERDSAISAKGRNNSDLPPLTDSEARILQRLQEGCDAMRYGDAILRKQTLDELDRLLADENRDARGSIAAIRAFLRTGADAETGEPFTVGEQGTLATANTMRVFLMDHLGSLCRETGRSDALDAAHEVFGRKDSADEWAISLRNMAWLDNNSGDYLRQRLSEMLTYEPWVQQPTTGMMEAFDIAVHTTATDLIPVMGEFASTTESPLNQASSVALDRLAERHPAETASWLLNQPGALDATPQVRADLFAKLDPADAAQRQLIESYLGRNDISVEERAKCLDSLAAPGSFVSQSLLTQPQTPPTAEREALRLAGLRDTCEKWLEDGRFSDLKSQITEIVARTTANKSESAD